ncbi:DNA-helicase [Sesbania bispinosa]|nr:DNA-helicase [Sesbania bispinosa]
MNLTQAGFGQGGVMPATTKGFDNVSNESNKRQGEATVGPNLLYTLMMMERCLRMLLVAVKYEKRRG